MPAWLILSLLGSEELLEVGAGAILLAYVLLHDGKKKRR
jgi:hypothetical protein